MSFEGYYQVICEKGHYWTEDCWAYYHEGDIECGICSIKDCNAGIAWTNLVDITNGSWDKEGNRIDGYKEPILISEKKCKHCNSILERLYKPV